MQCEKYTRNINAEEQPSTRADVVCVVDMCKDGIYKSSCFSKYLNDIYTELIRLIFKEAGADKMVTNLLQKYGGFVKMMVDDY